MLARVALVVAGIAYTALYALYMEYACAGMAPNVRGGAGGCAGAPHGVLTCAMRDCKRLGCDLCRNS